MSTIEEVLYAHREDALTCYDHGGTSVWCCACGEHGLTGSHRAHVAEVLWIADRLAEYNTARATDA